MLTSAPFDTVFGPTDLEKSRSQTGSQAQYAEFIITPKSSCCNSDRSDLDLEAGVDTTDMVFPFEPLFLQEHDEHEAVAKKMEEKYGLEVEISAKSKRHRCIAYSLVILIIVVIFVAIILL
jgi:hypothetical protein